MLDSELRQAIMQSWDSAALEISTKEPLDDSRAAALRSFYEGAGLTTEESLKFQGRLAVYLSNTLWHIFHGSPYPYEPNASFSLQRGRKNFFYSRDFGRDRQCGI